ncbi:hypothetical protein [Haloarchaeobius baliensis]|uniref:hypothetical protein n=1 Tax=Haloarchaeobius baliensis TaxID=1670458 RepID=UPI003F883764
MGTRSTDRIRGIAFLVSGILAAALIVYLLVSPEAFTALHPIPLLALLLLTMAVAFWQAREILR